nr:hypothetical protein [Tanacetum cinerariifolium]
LGLRVRSVGSVSEMVGKWYGMVGCRGDALRKMHSEFGFRRKMCFDLAFDAIFQSRVRSSNKICSNCQLGLRVRSVGSVSEMVGKWYGMVGCRGDALRKMHSEFGFRRKMCFDLAFDAIFQSRVRSCPVLTVS